jgi:hypothetical protein
MKASLNTSPKKQIPSSNAENMAHLKVLQENNHWEEFWIQNAA